MVQESGLVCRVCGTVNDKKAKFCNECGNKLKQEKACPVFEKNKEEQGITDKRFGSGLMADDFKFGEEIDEKQKVFGSSINRDEINIITFSDNCNLYAKKSKKQEVLRHPCAFPAKNKGFWHSLFFREGKSRFLHIFVTRTPPSLFCPESRKQRPVFRTILSKFLRKKCETRNFFCNSYRFFTA